MMRRMRAGLAGLALVGLVSCGGTPSLPVPEEDEWRAATVADMEFFPQDLEYYAGQAGQDPLLPDQEESREQNERFARLFFAAWSQDRPGTGNAEFFRGELARKGSRRGYAENLQPWSDERWERMERNADMTHFPSMRQAAITVRPASLRLAPTRRPRFVHPDRAGQGFPFDEFQQTALPPGFPLMAFHRTLDGAWLYVESALASGWIPAVDTAFADEDLRRRWTSARRAAFVQDDVPLLSASGVHLGQAGIGTVLPVQARTREDLVVLVPARNAEGWAAAAEARVSNTQAAIMPLPLRADQIAAMGNRLLGQAYGWGGLYGNRDCSAMMRDLFVPFGVWLPRNSAAQARAGRFVSFEGLSPEEKKTLIRQEGRPFLTLLWLPGHIGLYVGEHQGEPAFFHNLWGLRTGDGGRFVLGRAVVTSTMPGKERPDLEGEGLLLRMKGMTVLGDQ